jgi:Flp pilus assembly protein TadG
MTRKRNFIKQTEGATAIIIALALFALIGVASLAIDMGQLYSVRNELQNVADAAALAGAGQLIQKDASGNAVRDSDLAKSTAIQVAQTQSQLQGQAAVADGARDDLIIHFGAWDLTAANPSLAWADLGTSVPGTSNANAMRVTINRGAGTIFGPVSNVFAQIMGFPTSAISASATAYLGFTSGVQKGAIQVPLALPGTGPNSPLVASNGRAGWFARLLGPSEAVATTTKTLTFKDTGGSTVSNNVPTSPAAALDSNQAYLYTVGQNDSIPGTIKDILTKVYNPTYTSSNPVYVADLKRGQQIYPRSEYPWGRSNIGPIFQKLQQAYNAKKDANGKWRTTLVVHGPKPTASLPGKAGFLSLARLLAPFWASEAYACTTVNPPAIIAATFVNADITGVTYNSTTSNDGNYTYPTTIATPPPASGSTTYASKKDFLTRYPNSTWNLNTVTITNVTDASTVSPPGSLSGGPSADKINTAAPANVGSFAGNVPMLVQ